MARPHPTRRLPPHRMAEATRTRRFEAKRARGPRALPPLARWATIAASLGLLVGATGCFGLLLVGGAGTSAIAFATGELRSTEKTPLTELDAACASAVDVLGYDEVETERNADRIRWRARTASGEPVTIRLVAKGPESTEVRIRIGVFGDEAKSRLVLEEIHQAL
ncbi:MAG: DUF3568 family protein [Myxococcota bacterium]